MTRQTLNKLLRVSLRSGLLATLVQRLPRFLSAATLLAASVPVSALAAGNTGWFAGISIEYIKYRMNADDLSGLATASGLTGVSTSITDDNDTSWKVMGGYQFHRNFAVEVGHVDLGDLNFTTTTAEGTVNGDVEICGVYVDAVGIWPASERFSLLGKIGAYRWDMDTYGAALGGGVAFKQNANAIGTSLKLGIGGEYRFRHDLAVRAEYERFNDVGKRNNTGKADVDLWSMGLNYRF